MKKFFSLIKVAARVALVSLLTPLREPMQRRFVLAMAEFGPQKIEAFQANADLSAKQYIILSLVGTNLVDQATDPTSSLIFGVLQNNPKANEAASVAYSGRSKIQVGGGVVAINTKITTNSSGRAVAVASGQMCIGTLLEAAVAEGDICGCLLMEPVRWTGVA